MPRRWRRCGATAAGASDRHRHVPLPPGCTRLPPASAADGRSAELRRAGLAQDVIAHRRGLAGMRAQCVTQCGLGRKRTSITMSASIGRPCQNPNDSTVTLIPATVSPPKAFSILACSAGTDSDGCRSPDRRSREPEPAWCARRRFPQPESGLPCKVAAAVVLVTADQDLVGGLHEQHSGVMWRAARSAHHIKGRR